MFEEEDYTVHEVRPKKVSIHTEDKFIPQDTIRQLQCKKQKIYTNKKGANENEIFMKICRENNLEPTPRQYSKFRRGFGRAYTIFMELTHGN